MSEKDEYAAYLKKFEWEDSREIRTAFMYAYFKGAESRNEQVNELYDAIYAAINPTPSKDAHEKK